MSYDAVIFDLDGVLLDSAKNNFQWANTPTRKKAAEFGYKVKGRVKPILFEVSSYEEFEREIEESRFTIEEYIEIERAVAEKKVELVKNGGLELFPAAEKVMRELEVPASVVSNAYGDAVDRMIPLLGLDDHLEFWTAPRLDEIERYHSVWKPETHMLEKAMEKMSASRPVMVGDSEFDIKAAHNAGIDSVIIERSHNSVNVDPDHRISSLEELLEIVSQ